ncbi:MAG: 1-acyl-sn-glycerol-3-phosphate acyltransferase [Bacteroidota bacterium]|nr:1-acyl-sn-glycerol-3-phosphate acyltransferase [Bacteroidota bacterium]
MEKIDIKQVFKNKNPKVAKLIPGFIYNYLKRIIHEKELNAAIESFGDKRGLDFVKAGIDYFNMEIIVKGKENIPNNGRFLFSANHPLGGLDGIVFTYIVGQNFPDVKFFVNDLLMAVKNMSNEFIPINKHGKQTTEYVKKINETYQSDSQILNFPAGLCSRKQNGKILDLEWKKSFIAKAIKHKRDIVPIHINGQNSSFFYNLSNFRTFLGIKTNFEMFYLVDEMFKQKNKKIIFTIGKPISYKKFDKTKKNIEWASEVKNYVYFLEKNNQIDFNDYLEHTKK